MNKKILIGIVFVIAVAAIGAYFLLMPKVEKVYRVGILSGLDYFADTVDGFSAKMTELGYIEGKNITYDLEKANVDIVLYRSILKKFVDEKVDLIFVFPTEAALEAKAATQGTDIPVVFANVNIENTGLVNSVSEPGGNVSGVRFSGPDLTLRRFEILRELAPYVKRILIPYQRDYPIIANQLEALRPLAASAGLAIIEVPIDNPTELEADLGAIVKPSDISSDAVLCIVEPFLTVPDNLATLSNFAVGHKLPICGCPVSENGSESIFETSPDSVDVGKLAASIADKVLTGIPAGTISVITPEPRLKINYKVAQEFGLTVPEGLLNQAQEIIR